MGRRFVVLGSALLIGGCSGKDDVVASSGTPGCVPGEWLRDDGVCVPAGLPPDMPCPPGEWLRETDGACIPAGVPPDGCGEGFAHDGDRGCEPILPPEPCPDGLIAVPGDTRCREVAPCAPGSFGDIPIEADTEYVDASYMGGASDGSLAAPWTTIQEGIDAALPGAIVAVAAGSYLEEVLVEDKPVRLWGKCPALVVLTGPMSGFAALDIGFDGASGTEVHRLGITGEARGVYVTGAEDVLIAETWIHDTALRGIVVQDDLGPTSITVRRALVERAHVVGVFVAASDATVEATLVRDTIPDEQGFFGSGVSAVDSAAARASLVVVRSLLEGNHEAGVNVAGSDATVDATLVRDTVPDVQTVGRGINARDNPATAARASVNVLRSIIERNQDSGVFVAGSDATVDATVVRDSIPDAQGLFGRGIDVQIDPETGARATITVARSLLERNHEAGVAARGSDATVDATVIRDNLLNARGRFGQGIIVLDDADSGAAASAAVRFSLIERNREMGISVVGADATVEATVVRDILHSVPELGSAGIRAHDDSLTGRRSRLTVVGSLLERNQSFGLAVDGADATMETSEVRDTVVDEEGEFARAVQVASSLETGAASSAVIRASLFDRSLRSAIGVIGAATAEIDACVVRDTAAVDDYLGDGLVVWSLDGPASAAVTATRIEESARAAVSSFGAIVAIGGSHLVCQSFDIGAETWQGQPAVFDDRGGVLCGCPEATERSKAQSYALDPPPAE